MYIARAVTPTIISLHRVDGWLLLWDFKPRHSAIDKELAKLLKSKAIASCKIQHIAIYVLVYVIDALNKLCPLAVVIYHCC